MYDTINAVKAMRDFMEALFGPKWEDDVNFKGTPDRVVRSFSELLRSEDPKVKADALRRIITTQFDSLYNGIIFVPNITAFSVCPHHLLPVSYKVTLAYIPGEGKKVLGASKLERLVRTLAARAILQEDLTHEIIDILERGIRPGGIAVVVSGKHDCMATRGVKSLGTFETSEMIGSFKDNMETREEFFNLLKIAMMRNGG